GGAARRARRGGGGARPGRGPGGAPARPPPPPPPPGGGAGWGGGAAGAPRACFEAALKYAGERTAFGKPIAGTQIQQQKLAHMALEVNRATLLALHLGRLKDAGRLRPEQVSMGKLGNVNAALDVARSARQVLGANGISLEYPVIRHMNNLESVVTYEGTADVHALVIGGALTGVQAFR
ncbi:acyl-CoA dehydrogenase family protein, partial [Actinomadura geliboluensis]|uniref:acyl-CoA dehydrogenase family protein n=1 Tax=Actinomadura geliboluensis TaxID=882440 RepID=UPI0037147728